VLRVIVAALTLAVLMPATVAADQPPPIAVTKMVTAVDQANRVHWVSCVSFANASTRTVQAIRFLFTYYDAFDEPIQTFTADRVGEFAPGVAIEGASPESLLGASNCWSIIGRVPSLSKVSVETVKVRFGDNGEVWTPPEPRTKFTITTLTNFDTNHPDTIVCGGMIKLRFKWAAAQQVPNCRKAIEDWEKLHQFSAANAASSASPEPTAAP
jgi:hypothetical protein